jgi:manganese/zinc/iron transport system permease protein
MIPAESFPIVMVLVTVAITCAGPGVFLMLRKQTLIADAISHVILLGIVVAYLIVRDLESPWLVLGATLSGILTVWLVETLQRSRHVSSDMAIGIIFPALFALGTLLATRYLRNTHLDVDRVLLGSAELAPLDTVAIGSVTLPRSLVPLALLAVANTVVGYCAFRPLLLTTFDPALAQVLGLRPYRWHMLLMLSLSLTIVLAFDAVGPVLVVAFLAIPAAIGTLLVHRLAPLLLVSTIVAALASGLGAWVAIRQDWNCAGTCTTTLALGFLLAWLLAPEQGVVPGWRRRRRQRAAWLERLSSGSAMPTESPDVPAR